MQKKYVRTGFTVITPYLTVNDAATLIEFLKFVFEGTVIDIDKKPDGSIANAVISIDDSRIYISDATEQWGQATCVLHIHVKDVDVVYHKAMKSGAESIHEPVDMSYGERGAGIKDMFGNTWWIATYTG